MNEHLYQVTLSYLCAGLLVRNGRVVCAAPILHWAVGKPLSTVQQWAMRKGGTCLAVHS